VERPAAPPAAARAPSATPGKLSSPKAQMPHPVAGSPAGKFAYAGAAQEGDWKEF
jgi:hypothetical protein